MRASAKITQKYEIDPIKMFQATKTIIPICIDFENLVRYHFGVFAFTGGGKSNLMSNIPRQIYENKEDWEFKPYTEENN